MVKGALEENHFQDAACRAESAMTIGTMVAWLLGAGTAWWLGGNSVLLGAVGGFVAAVALPQMRTALNQFVPSFHKLNGGGEAPLREANISKTAREQGASAPASERYDLNDARLGELSPVSSILPGGKRSGTKSRQ